MHKPNFGQNISCCCIPWLFALVASLTSLTSAVVSADEGIVIATITRDEPVDFEKDILPIFRRSCLACHNSTDAEGEFVLETPQTILAGGDSGNVVEPGKSGASLLLQVAAHLEDPIMPPEDNEANAPNLTSKQLGLIKLWIDQGAKGTVSGDETIEWQALPAGINPIYSVAVSPHADYVAAGRANQIFIYELATKQLLGRLTDPALLTQGTYDKPGVAHLDLVQSLAFAPGGQLLASGGYRNVKLWQRTVSEPLPINHKNSQVTSMATDGIGSLLALGHSDGMIEVISTSDPAVVTSLLGHAGPITALTLSKDGKTLVSTGSDKSLQVWNIELGSSIATIPTAGDISSMVLINDNKQVAAGGTDGVIRIWDLPAEKSSSAEPISKLSGHSGAVNSLALLSTTKQLVSASDDGTVRVWNTANAKQVRQLAHGGPVTGVAVSPDGTRIASSGKNNVAKLWDAASGKQLAEMSGDRRAEHRVAELDLETNLGQQHVVNVKKDLDEANKRKKSEEENAKKAAEALTKAEAEQKKKSDAVAAPVAAKEKADKEKAGAVAALEALNKTKTQAETDLAAAVAVIKQQQTLLEKTIETEKSSAALAKQMAEQLADIQAAAKDAEQKRQDAAAMMAKLNISLAAEKEKQSAAKTAIAKTQPMLKKAGEQVKKTEEVAKKAAAPADKALAEKKTADRSLDASQRGVKRAEEAKKSAIAAVPVVETIVKSQEQTLESIRAELALAKEQFAKTKVARSCVAFSPDGIRVAVGGVDGAIHVYSAADGTGLDIQVRSDTPIQAIAFAADSQLISLATDDAVVVGSIVPEWKLARTIGSTDSAAILIDRVIAIDFSPDGKLFATGGGDPSRSGELKIWNVADGSLVREIKDSHSDTIFDIEFSPDGKSIASCGADRFMKVFTVADGALVRTFEGHTGHVLGVSWRADGQLLASSGADNVVKVWDYRTGGQKKTIAGFKKEVTSLQFLAVSDNMVITSGDSSVTTKNSGGGGGPKFSGAKDFVYSAQSSLDGTTVVAGGQDSIVYVWDGKGKSVVNFVAPDLKSQQ